MADVVAHKLSSENVCHIKLGFESLYFFSVFFVASLEKVSSNSVGVYFNAYLFCFLAYFFCYLLLSIKSIGYYVGKFDGVKAHFLGFCNTVKLSQLARLNILMKRIRAYRNFHYASPFNAAIYRSLFRSSSGASAERSAGGISRTVLQPLSP